MIELLSRSHVQKEAMKAKLIEQLKRELSDLRETQKQCSALRAELIELEMHYEQECNANNKGGAVREYKNHEANESWYEHLPAQQDKRARLVEGIHHAKKELARKAQQNQQQLQKTIALQGSLERQDAELRAAKEQNSQFKILLQNQQMSEQEHKDDRIAEKQGPNIPSPSKAQIKQSIKYIGELITEVKADIQEQALLLADIQEDISFFEQSKQKMREQNNKLLKHIRKLKQERDRKQAHLKQQQENIWQLKERTYRDRAANGELMAELSRIQDIMESIMHEHRQLQIELNKIRLNDEAVQGLLSRHRRRKLQTQAAEEESDLNKTVLRSSVKPRKSHQQPY